MSAPVVDDSKRGFRAPGTGFMVGGSLLGAFGAYVFQWYPTNFVEADQLTPWATLWTLFFILVTVLLIPVEQYVTREVARGRRSLPKDWGPALVMTLVGSTIGAAFVWFTLDSLFEGDPIYVLQIVLLVAGYSLLCMGKGILAGSRRFGEVGWVFIVESGARLVAGIALWAMLASSTSLGWAMVIGAFAVVALRWWRRDEGDGSVPATPASGFLLGYVGGSSSSQLLLAGAPIAVWALGGSPAMVSIMFYTFTLFRAPLTLIFSLQGRILPYLVGLSHADKRQELARISRNVVLVGSGIALLGGLVGWLVGPWVVEFLYGASFAPSTIVATLAAAGVMAAAAAQIASQVLVAAGKTKLLGFAWFGGLAAAVVVTLLVGGAPDTRVAIGFVTGEVAALGLMAFLATRR